MEESVARSLGKSTGREKSTGGSQESPGSRRNKTAKLNPFRWSFLIWQNIAREGNGCQLSTANSFSARNFGWSGAHEAIPVPLLPSGPGGVRGTSLHRARSSTLWQSVRTRATSPLREYHRTAASV